MKFSCAFPPPPARKKMRVKWWCYVGFVFGGKKSAARITGALARKVGLMLFFMVILFLFHLLKLLVEGQSFSASK